MFLTIGHLPINRTTPGMNHAQERKAKRKLLLQEALAKRGSGPEPGQLPTGPAIVFTAGVVDDGTIPVPTFRAKTTTETDADYAILLEEFGYAHIRAVVDRGIQKCYSLAKTKSTVGVKNPALPGDTDIDFTDIQHQNNGRLSRTVAFSIHLTAGPIKETDSAAFLTTSSSEQAASIRIKYEGQRTAETVEKDRAYHLYENTVIEAVPIDENEPAPTIRLINILTKDEYDSQAVETAGTPIHSILKNLQDIKVTCDSVRLALEQSTPETLRDTIVAPREELDDAQTQIHRLLNASNTLLLTSKAKVIGELTTIQQNNGNAYYRATIKGLSGPPDTTYSALQEDFADQTAVPDLQPGTLVGFYTRDHRLGPPPPEAPTGTPRRNNNRGGRGGRGNNRSGATSTARANSNTRLPNAVDVIVL